MTPQVRYSVPPGFDPNSVVMPMVVPNEMSGQRLDRFVHWKIPRLTRSRAEWIVDRCATTVDGQRLPSHHRVNAKDVILLVRERFVEPDAPETFEVVFEDDDLLVVNKPPGLPVHPSATYHRRTLSHLLRARFGDPQPQMAHRLDRETSGLVICGKRSEITAFLHKAFADRRVQKTYLAIVRGIPAEHAGTIEVALRRKVAKDQAAAEGELHTLVEVCADDAPNAWHAKTTYRVVEVRGQHALVELVPHTGRQHQLRVHLAHIGHPIVGDKLYGPFGIEPFMRGIQERSLDGSMDALTLEQLGFARHLLHAYALVVPSLAGAGTLRFEAALPPDMSDYWDALTT